MATIYHLTPDLKDPLGGTGFRARPEGAGRKNCGWEGSDECRHQIVEVGHPVAAAALRVIEGLIGLVDELRGVVVPRPRVATPKLAVIGRSRQPWRSIIARARSQTSRAADVSVAGQQDHELFAAVACHQVVLARVS